MPWSKRLTGILWRQASGLGIGILLARGYPPPNCQPAHPSAENRPLRGDFADSPPGPYTWERLKLRLDPEMPLYENVKPPENKNRTGENIRTCRVIVDPSDLYLIRSTRYDGMLLYPRKDNPTEAHGGQGYRKDDKFYNPTIQITVEPTNEDYDDWEIVVSVPRYWESELRFDQSTAPQPLFPPPSGKSAPSAKFELVNILPKFGLSSYARSGGLTSMLGKAPILFGADGRPIPPPVPYKASSEYRNKALYGSGIYCVKLPGQESTISGTIRARLFKEGKVVEAGVATFVFRINNYDGDIYYVATPRGVYPEVS